MAAEVLAQGGARVSVYDAMPSAGRKFLMAGRGGLNLTHSEPLPEFMARYREAAPRLRAAIEAFSPEALRGWSEALGEPTFVGTSGRVFPKAFKASPLLRAWLRRLDAAGVRFAFRHRWIGWDGEGRLLFRTNDGQRPIEAKATVLALGGASWPRLGSDGGWADILASKGVAISKLRPANSGFTVAWSDVFHDRFEGQPLKGVALTIGAHTVRGEAMITRSGIEGGAIYTLSAELREAVLGLGQATLTIALRPELDVAALTTRLSGTRGKRIAGELPAQGGAAVAGRHRPDAGGRHRIRPAAGDVLAGGACEADQRYSGSAHRRCPDRARHLDRGRGDLRRARRTPDAARAARRVRRRRDAGLGGADRRLSVAGVVCDGGGGRKGRVAMARVVLITTCRSWSEDR
ncbi:putative flavoprotein (TIGR03862 family) [Bradyrhizobium sp. i1.3.1]